MCEQDTPWTCPEDFSRDAELTRVKTATTGWKAEQFCSMERIGIKADYSAAGQRILLEQAARCAMHGISGAYMIKLENVSLDIYGARERVLSSINWHIKEGENWVLFGRNGSGKTKLLEIITGYLFPTEGEVYRFGNGHMGSDIREVRTRIGYISSALKEKFSGAESLIDSVLSGYYASVGLYRKPPEKAVEHVRVLIEELGLGGREHDVIRHLSDGERQKVMVLRALVNDPDILIFDEPSAGLDIAAREELLDSINTIASARNISTVYVTHHVEEIIPLFEKIFILDSGACFFNGTVEDAFRKKVFKEIFGRRIEVFKRNGRFHSSIL